LERRTLPEEKAGGFLREVRGVLSRLLGRNPAVDARARLELARPGSEVPPEAPLVGGLRQTLREHGLADDPRGMTAWVDAAYLNEAGVPAVCFGPGSIAQAHAADEWVSTDEIRIATAVLEDFVRRFLSGG
jgi:acetylornithine deacetylase